MADGTQLAKAYVQILPSMDGFQNSLESALGGSGASAGKSFGTSFASAAGSIAQAGLSAITAVASATTDFAKSAVSAGQTFDKSMSQVAATMGNVDNMGEDAFNSLKQAANEMGIAFDDTTTATELSTAVLRDFAQEMGASTAFSASEAADALNYMALAGYDAATSMDMLPNVLNLAAAGGMQLASASDMITDSQTALGLSIEETSELVDMMAKTASTTNTSVSQLGDAILTVGGTAKNLAGGTDELNAVLGVMADNGIKASDAGIHLRNIMLAMTPSTEAAANAFAALGLETYDSEGKLRNLDSIFLDLSESMKDMTDEEKTNALSAIFNKTDLTTVNALLATSADRWEEVYDAIGNASGAAQEMADTQLDNLAGDITYFQSALEGAKITLSDQLTPTLREFVQLGTDGLSRVTTAFQEGGLDAAMEEFGDWLADALNKITSMLPDIIKAGGTLVNALAKGLADNLPFIITALTDAVGTVLPQLLETGKILLSAIFTGVSDNLPEILTSALEIVTTLANDLAEALPELIPAVLDMVITIAQTLMNPDTLLPLINAALAVVMGLVEGITNSLPELVNAALSLVMTLTNFILDNLPMLLDTAVDIVLTLVDGITDNLPEIAESAGVIIAQLVAAIAENLPEIVKQGLEITMKLIDGLLDALPDIVKAAVMLIGSLALEFTKYDWLGIGKNIIDGLVNGVNSFGNNLITAVLNTAANAFEAVKDFFGIASPSKLMKNEIGKFIPAGIAEGITDNTQPVTSAMDNLARITADTSNFDSAVPVSALRTSQAYFSTAEFASPKNTPSPSDSQGAEKTPVVIQIVSPDGRNIAEWLIDDINDLLGKKIALAGRGVQ